MTCTREPQVSPFSSSDLWIFRYITKKDYTPGWGFVNLLRLKLSSNAQIVYLVLSYPVSSPLRARDFGPALESLPHLLPVVRRRQQMSSRSEVLGDRTIGGMVKLLRLIPPSDNRERMVTLIGTD